MTSISELEEAPWRFDFFDSLRRIERRPDGAGADGTSMAKPRIGDASSRREELVLLGQDPYFNFPASNLSKLSKRPDGRIEILVKFLGLLGPQGALPLATTEEAHYWLLARDDAFPRFLDIINHRFLQLFFRAWADSRPAAQHDRPAEDRFHAYIGSAVGIGSAPFRDLDSVPDGAKLGYAGLLGAKAKSASRLRGAIRGLFGVEVEVEEFVGSRLQLASDDCTRLGANLSALGVDTMLGRTFYSVEDKIRIRIYAPDLIAYKRFLPEGDRCEPLVDLVFFYLGEELDWDVELAIPATKIQNICLGKSGELGWTSWLSPDLSATGYRCDALFHPAERMRRKREADVD
ncbi:type VI secretion system baseplate subunit TssG [uncultured Rhodoblastus sp.]|uniref:type VI secretion system baseplate subunit TssG n=1 Tax=uncultured Rhodoblastus sp. TaxID=543037 RepID=UPI0025D40FD6|nr:type VI secretion system baseplate subunit TssG [uncultured Rhodoblastus sp.]